MSGKKSEQNWTDQYIQRNRRTIRRNSATCKRTYATQYITVKLWKGLALNAGAVNIVTGSKVIE